MRNLVMYSIIILIALNSCKTESDYFNQPEEISKLSTLCKVWGFLKYYDPIISSSNIDWDSVLITYLESASKYHSDSFKYQLDKLIPLRNYSNTESPCSIDSLNYKNTDLKWLSDTSLLLPQSIDKLKLIHNHKYNFENKYIQPYQWVENPNFELDTLYNNMNISNVNIRILSLFRYWNMINYYYPYKYLCDSTWNSVLELFIPIFLKNDDPLNFHLAVCKLTSYINDNHGYTDSDILNSFYGARFLPAKLKYIEGETVVTGFYSDSLKKNNNLKTGDIILYKDSIEISRVRDSLLQFFSGSNEIMRQHTVSYYIPRSNKEVINLKILRNDSIYDVTVRTYSRDFLRRNRVEEDKAISREINDYTTYVDLGKVKYHQVDSVFSKIINSKAIILDLRNNCEFIVHDLCNILFPTQFQFYSYTTLNYCLPGTLKRQLGENIGPQNFNKDFYNGQLILLANYSTQSIGEFTLMALKKHKNAVIIGNTTAGADGNVSIIKLPGGINTYISGIGIYWPNGEETQRVGISPDIEVFQDIESTKNGSDKILHKAAEYANSIINQ